MALNVLVIDDEKDIRLLLSEILSENGFNPLVAANSTQALEILNSNNVGAAILDVWLQGSELDGLGILEIVKKRHPLLPVVVISGHGTIQTAVNAIKLGAYDYVEKPFTHDKLLLVLRRACEFARLRRENIDLRSKVVDKTEIVGSSPAINKLKLQIEKAAPTSGRVMIFGAVGSGKELTARVIHKKSKYSNGPFIVFSPTGFSPEKIQQELFGDPQQSVGDSYTKRLSLLEAANGGTLYIDEVGHLPISVQTRLLHVIQSQSFKQLSTDKIVKLDLRFVTSTSMDLMKAVATGRFREDLYYRLNVIPIQVPSLAEHKDDIGPLVAYFVQQLNKLSGLRHREFSNEAIVALQSYNWPGNVRELKNIVEWTMVMNPVDKMESTKIRPDMLPDTILKGSSIMSQGSNGLATDFMSMSLREAREMFERYYLSAQMRRFSNNISKTSEFVGMERSALHRKLKSLSIHAVNAHDPRQKLDDDDDQFIYNTESSAII